MVILSYAENSDASSSNVQFVVIALAIIGIVGLMAAIPAAVARRRGHRHGDAIATSLVLWAILTAGITIYSISSQTNYWTEYNRRLMSGYLDPRDTSDRPKPPWMTVIGLVAAYGGLLVWIRLEKPPKAS